jgi:hypothetical protein
LNLEGIVRHSYRYGKPFIWKDRELIPVSNALVLGARNMLLRLVWNRPAGVIVRESDGSEQWLPIRDTTRRAQLVFLVITLLTMFVARQGRKR